MKVIIADNPAFCYGVERAYNLAKQQNKQNVFTWGPLIHNPQIVKELQQKGIKIVSTFHELKKGDTVILRAHGISNKTKKQLEKKEIAILDGTCPFVTKAHLIAQKFIENNYQLVIIGDRNHPEIQGIYEDFPQAIVIKDLTEIAKHQNKLRKKKLGIICQTTIKNQAFQEIIENIKLINSQLVFENTICNATHAKQDAARKLAEQVDCMLIVGGKNSNNTKMLYEICRKYCLSYFISNANEIKISWFKNCKRIGITGGASTPLWLIEKVKKKIIKL